ncbi:hypothetical protein B0H16DRAFT_1324905, partial [Mycena metata]
GNWTKDFVQLAKTAELKKRALTLQPHTAHILLVHASLEQNNRALQAIMEQPLEKLSMIQNRNLAFHSYPSLPEQADVDRLGVDLGQPPLLESAKDDVGRSGAGYVSMGFAFAAAMRLRPMRRTELSNSVCARVGPCSELSSSSESVRYESISRNSARMRVFFILE